MNPNASQRLICIARSRITTTHEDCSSSSPDSSVLPLFFKKKPFEAHLGITHNPSNKSLPESYVHAWVTFYGEVKNGQFATLH